MCANSLHKRLKVGQRNSAGRRVGTSGLFSRSLSQSVQQKNETNVLLKLRGLAAAAGLEAELDGAEDVDKTGFAGTFT